MKSIIKISRTKGKSKKFCLRLVKSLPFNNYPFSIVKMALITTTIIALKYPLTVISTLMIAAKRQLLKSSNLKYKSSKESILRNLYRGLVKF